MSYLSEIFGNIRSDLSSPFGFTVINIDGKKVYVDGFVRVIGIDCERVDFLLKKRVISVLGKGLTLLEVDGNSAVVEGEIGSVLYE